METRRDVFQALADPNRRAILGLLAQKTHTLNGVADNFNISRPAISRHIKILTECGLVIISQQGRERYCEARLNKLDEVTTWIGQYKKIWAQRFDSLQSYLDDIQSERSEKPAKTVKRKKFKTRKH
jgi:DNA-binding transcriptional ArsR family regulator